MIVLKLTGSIEHPDPLANAVEYSATRCLFWFTLLLALSKYPR